MKSDGKQDMMSPVMGMLLFLGTALASQILQEKLRHKRKYRERINRRQLYQQKRLAERMSFDNMDEYLNHVGQVDEKDGSVHSLRPDAALRDYSQSSRGGLTKSSNGSSRRESTLSVQSSNSELAPEYFPKNNNWCHFENHQSDEDEDASTSSASESFLWTPATRAQRRRRKRRHQRTASEDETWTSKVLHPIVQLTRSLGSVSSSPIDFSDDEDVIGPVYAGEEAEGRMPSEPTMAPVRFPAPYQPSGNKRQHSAPTKMVRSSSSIPDLMANANNWDEQQHAQGESMLDVPLTNRAARAVYNARIMPNKVVMVRHGQSEGNVDERMYSMTPDNAMRLTRLGWEQAHRAGIELKQRVLATGEPVHFIVSPYVRTVETFHGIVSAWCDPSEFDHIRDRERRLKAWYGKLLELGLTWHEDPRIREQDFGNYQDPKKIKQYKSERHKFGPFFYRFPHGESASDVFDRASTFLDSLWRSFDLNRSRNYVLVTHGIAIRVLLARYFRYSIDQFSLLANPKNCEMVILGHDGKGKLQLEGRAEPTYENGQSPDKQLVGYEYSPRLRVLPKQYVRKLKVRIGPDDDLESSSSERATDNTSVSSQPVSAASTLPTIISGAQLEPTPKAPHPFIVNEQQILQAASRSHNPSLA